MTKREMKERLDKRVQVRKFFRAVQYTNQRLGQHLRRGNLACSPIAFDTRRPDEPSSWLWPTGRDEMEWMSKVVKAVEDARPGAQVSQLLLIFGEGSSRDSLPTDTTPDKRTAERWRKDGKESAKARHH